MHIIRKLSKKLFTNKYVDLFVVLVVFFSILLLVFDSLAGFIINKNALDNLKFTIDSDKLEALEILEGKKFSSDVLTGILEKSWLQIQEDKEFYKITGKTEYAISKENKAKVSLLASLKDREYSEEELYLKLKEFEFTPVEIEIVFLYSIHKMESLKDKISPGKAKFIKLLKYKEFTKEELIKKLLNAEFNERDINITLSHTKKLIFNKNEIALILKESQLVFPISEKTKDLIIALDDIIIAFFIIELFLRYLSCDNYKIFFYLYWIDILAVIPLFRVFRLSRVFILLRLFRIMSFAVLLRRHLSFVSFIFNKRWIDFFLILIFLIFIITFGTLGLISSEEKLHLNPQDAFWTTVFSLFCGEYSSEFPETLVGKLTALLVILAGISFFAILIGTVSAIMMEKFKEGIIMRKTNFDMLENHIIICGWEQKTHQIIKELHASPECRHADIVLISDREDFLHIDLERFDIKTDFIYLIEGDFTDPDILRKANIDNAKIAIILPDRSGGRNNRDIDARTVLTALTIEKLNHSVYSCAELLDPEYESHMKIGNVNEVILGGYYSGLMAAHAAINENIVPFINSILPSEAEHKFQNISLSNDLIGKEFSDVILELRKKDRILPLGVRTASGDLLINPQNYIMKNGDYLVGLVSKS